MLLDTHVVLWWQAGGERLSATAADAIEQAATLLVSPISCWEIATLEAKGTIALDRDARVWVRDLLSQDRLLAAPLTPTAAVEAGRLGHAGFHGDPADRLLWATARERGVPLVTKDTAMRRFAAETGELTVLW